MPLIACVDVGSTFTKAALVDIGSGGLRSTASAPTTIDSDVMHGVETCIAELNASATSGVDEIRICSSAGGGLRLAVVGYERAVSAEAGRRVALSAGGHVVHVAAGELTEDGAAALSAARPDVVLLVGGTDGGNAEILLANATRLAGSDLGVPVVVAGNADARERVVAVLTECGVPVRAVDNVLPRIGELDPGPARSAIRDVFIAHVIGGKHLSASTDFATQVRAATPDAVLAGVELLADGAGSVGGVGDVLVVDVGGATTDVYSVVTPDPEEAALHREVVEVLWRQRTVEGDLGMRWGAPGVVAAAHVERLLGDDGTSALSDAAAVRRAEPAYLPASDPERELDARLAGLALTVALRRHARASVDGAARNPGVDLRHVRLVVGSGGVLRHADPASAERILRPALGDTAGGWRLPERARVVVDVRYVLAAAGLLADDHAEAAASMLHRELGATS